MESLTLAVVGFAFLWSSKNISSTDSIIGKLCDGFEAFIGYFLLIVSLITTI